MDIHFYARTDVGKVREGNEDFFLNEKIAADEYLFAVADGMGGHQAGDVASKLASETFSEDYRTLRAKGTAIAEAMDLAIRKANLVVLKKAAADPAKRGMGTTFSAVVIAGLKGYVVHIGDSRIYLIRQRKIRKITTDHTFVEKLVENGRISAAEAREHPQKNVLYMSLGARDGFSPEVIDGLDLEEGDALVMCTDGLSNLVIDEVIRDTVLTHYPEEAARVLVHKANAAGGTDNITLQIIRIGSLAALEETKPLHLIRPRKRLTSLIAGAALLVILTAAWFLFKPFSPTRSAMVPDTPVAPAAGTVIPAAERFQELRELVAPPLSEWALLPSHFQFLAGQRLFIMKNGVLLVYRIGAPSLDKYNLYADDQIVPVVTTDIFILRKTKVAVTDYRLFNGRDERSPALVIRADANFIAKDIKTKTIRIPNLGKRLLPVFLTDDLFIFSDSLRYFGIKKWANLLDKDNSVFPLPEVSYTESVQVYFGKSGDGYRMIYYNPEEKLIRVFNIRKDFSRLQELSRVSIGTPLALEYLEDNSLACYLADRWFAMPPSRKQARPARTGWVGCR